MYAFHFIIHLVCSKLHFHSYLPLQLYSVHSNVSVSTRSTIHQSLHTEACIAVASSWSVLLKHQCEQSQGRKHWGGGKRKKKKKMEHGNTWTKFKELSISKILTNHLLLEIDTITFWSFYKGEGESQHLCLCMEISSKSWNWKSGKKF